MRKTFDSPATAASPASNYASAARVELAADGALVFVSGQGAIGTDGSLVGEGDVRRQTERTFDNIKAILEANGATLKDVVKLTIYMTDMSRRSEMAEVRGRYFPDGAPPSTAVEVKGLALPGLLVQMDAIAAA